MTKNFYRMSGLLIMMISFFFILAGLFLKGPGFPDWLAPVLLISGLGLLSLGIVFYKIIMSD